MRAAIATLSSVCLVTLAGCIDSNGDGSDPSDEIDCTGLTCDWTVKEGSPVFGATWHRGDLGIDLSQDGRAVIELRDVLFASQHERQLTLRSALLRDPSASISFELDFYAPGAGQGATFWDRAPVFLVTRKIDVVEQGTAVFHRPVLVPSEGAAVVLRVVKDGTGHAMIDELTLGT